MSGTILSNKNDLRELISSLFLIFHKHVGLRRCSSNDSRLMKDAIIELFGYIVWKNADKGKLDVKKRSEDLMDIQTNQYEIAPLENEAEALKLLEQTEASIAEMTGREVTLIAYEKSEAQQANPT